MLEENPSLKFKRKDWRGDIYVSSGCDGRLCLFDPNVNVSGNHAPHISACDWQLVREPVTWQEAMQAWANGGAVKCVIEITNDQYIFGEPYVKAAKACGYNIFSRFSREMIKHGIWYILENSNCE